MKRWPGGPPSSALLNGVQRTCSIWKDGGIIHFSISVEPQIGFPTKQA